MALCVLLGTSTKDLFTALGLLLAKSHQRDGVGSHPQYFLGIAEVLQQFLVGKLGGLNALCQFFNQLDFFLDSEEFGVSGEGSLCDSFSLGRSLLNRQGGTSTRPVAMLKMFRNVYRMSAWRNRYSLSFSKARRGRGPCTKRGLPSMSRQNWSSMMSLGSMLKAKDSSADSGWSSKSRILRQACRRNALRYQRKAVGNLGMRPCLIAVKRSRRVILQSSQLSCRASKGIYAKLNLLTSQIFCRDCEGCWLQNQRTALRRQSSQRSVSSSLTKIARMGCRRCAGAVWRPYPRYSLRVQRGPQTCCILKQGTKTSFFS